MRERVSAPKDLALLNILGSLDDLSGRERGQVLYVLSALDFYLKKQSPITAEDISLNFKIMITGTLSDHHLFLVDKLYSQNFKLFVHSKIITIIQNKLKTIGLELETVNKRRDKEHI